MEKLSSCRLKARRSKEQPLELGLKEGCTRSKLDKLRKDQRGAM